ncbi:MAG: enoyl-CoA hydratase/isomerase family protein [Rhodospirillales bacterium]|nr:enoyl-CoA hydratase/isomerase family protein [Rhodospirillales bacterium]
MEDEIIFEVRHGIGKILLNRPQALNALTFSQIRAMDRQLRAWAEDRSVRAVTIEGAGEKAFCAGGDIRAIYESRQREEFGALADFYREEYILNHFIKTFPKPYIALIDGIVMGGGVGVSIHGSHRIATERTLFAMPETGIGLFPDVGGTYFLSRCPGQIGMYLGLTGARLKAADSLYAELATHHVPTQRLPEIEQALWLEDVESELYATVSCILDAYHEDPGPAPLAEHREAIDRCFGEPSLDAIFQALAEEGTTWADEVLAGLRTKSPTSLLVTFKQIRLGAKLDFEQAMRIEYRLSQRFMAGHDFFEGVRAVIIDKDQKPRWRPASLDELSTEDIDAYFAPLQDGHELVLG